MLIGSCSHNVNVDSKIPQIFLFHNCIMFCRLSGYKMQQFKLLSLNFNVKLAPHMEQLWRQLSHSSKTYEQQEFHLF